LKLTENAAFREFTKAKPLEPLLVNAARGGYYLVPFSVDQKSSSLAVILDAYNREFQGVGNFCPRAFLTVRAALGQGRQAPRVQERFLLRTGEAERARV